MPSITEQAPLLQRLAQRHEHSVRVSPSREIIDEELQPPILEQLRRFDGTVESADDLLSSEGVSDVSTAFNSETNGDAVVLQKVITDEGRVVTVKIGVSQSSGEKWISISEAIEELGGFLSIALVTNDQGERIKVRLYSSQQTLTQEFTPDNGHWIPIENTA